MSRLFFIGKLFNGKLIATILGVLIIFFIAQFFIQQWRLIQHHTVQVDYRLIVVGMLIYSLFLCFQGIYWRQIMSSVGQRVTWLTALYFYLNAALLSYIPGKVANIWGVSAIARSENISKSIAVTALILSQLYAVISGALVMGLCWFFVKPGIRGNIPFVLTTLLLFLVLMGLVVLSPRFISGLFKVLSGILKRDVIKIKVLYRAHLINIAFYFVAWALLSFSVFCLANSFGERMPLNVLPSIGFILIASYIVTLLAFFVPAGLGIIEFGLLYGFSFIYPAPQALSVSVTYRIMALLAIFIVYFAILALKKAARWRFPV